MTSDMKCKAQRTADPPQDCDWPFCGCDPYAEKVLAAIEESGLIIVRIDEMDRLKRELDEIRAPWPTANGPKPVWPMG